MMRGRARHPPKAPRKHRILPFPLRPHRVIMAPSCPAGGERRREERIVGRQVRCPGASGAEHDGQPMAVWVMGGSGTDMPSLDAFDQEFGREPAAVLRVQQRSTTLRPLAGFLLAVAIISVPT